MISLPNKDSRPISSKMASETTPLSFDLEAYISRYPTTSETHLQRLLFLAHQFHNNASSSQNETSAAAFRLAISRMKSSGNHRRYQDEFAESSSCDNNPESTSSPVRHHDNKVQGHHIIQQYAKYDAQFVADAKASTASQLEVLEGRLSTAQSHINKESIRTALLALGEFLRGRGELREGFRRVVRSR